MTYGSGDSEFVPQDDILDTICQIRFGEPARTRKPQGVALTKSGEMLLAELTAYLKSNAGLSVSRQAVQYWFSKGSIPKRPKSLSFLVSYLKSHADAAALGADKLQLYDQTIQRLLEASRTDNQASGIADADHGRGKSHIRQTGRGRLSFDNHVARRKWDDLVRSTVGKYYTYRMRFSEDRLLPIAQELLEISYSRNELRFRHWYSPQGGDVGVFDGVVTLVGDTIWMIGYSEFSDGRLRVMNFKFANTIGDMYSTYHWGIMLAELSRSSHEPAACRVLLVRISVDDRGETPTPPPDKSVIRFLGDGDTPDAPLDMDQLQRFINNRRSARSIPGTTDPAVDARRHEIEDSILRVDRETVETFANMAQQK